MKILIVYNFLPFPNVGHGGGQYIFNFIKYFSKEHDLYLVCNYYGKNESHIKEITPYLKGFYGTKLDRDLTLKKTVFLGWKFIFSKYPLINHLDDSAKLRSNIVRVLNNHSIDIIYFENTMLAHLIDFIKKEYGDKYQGKIYLRHDEILYPVIKRNFINYLKIVIKGMFHLKISKKELFQFIECFQYFKYKKFEKGLWQKADLISTTSDYEYDIIKRSMPNGKIGIFYHGLSSISDKINELNEKNILYLGNYNHYPNVDAVNFFIKKIFPLVLAKIPDVKFYVVGGNPPKTFYKFAKENNSIKILGFVKDLSKILNNMMVMVVPVRIGGGIRSKILESFANGIAIVSSTVGIEGIYKLNEKEKFILHTNDPRKFANYIIKLIEDPIFRYEYIKNGQRAVRFFIWDNLFTKLEKFLQQNN
ncbi:MAG: glycosyltransferase [Promethearchaeota archaeon]